MIVYVTTQSAIERQRHCHNVCLIITSCQTLCRLYLWPSLRSSDLAPPNVSCMCGRLARSFVSLWLLAEVSYFVCSLSFFLYRMSRYYLLSTDRKTHWFGFLQNAKRRKIKIARLLYCLISFIFFFFFFWWWWGGLFIHPFQVQYDTPVHHCHVLFPSTQWPSHRKCDVWRGSASMQTNVYMDIGPFDGIPSFEGRCNFPFENFQQTHDFRKVDSTRKYWDANILSFDNFAVYMDMRLSPKRDMDPGCHRADILMSVLQLLWQVAEIDLDRRMDRWMGGLTDGRTDSERERERQRERERERDRQTDRQTDRDRERDGPQTFLLILIYSRSKRQLLLSRETSFSSADFYCHFA